MDRPVRIAAVGPLDDALLARLRELPLRPEVRTAPSLLGGGEALVRWQPDVLVVAFGGDAEQEVGALRLWRQLWPEAGVVVATDAAHELDHAALAARLHARVLVHPEAPGQLAAMLEQAREHSDRPRPDVFLDLVRGIADEINNPLLYVAGHLQLLRSVLTAPTDRDHVDMVAAALSGVARVEGSIERLHALSRAARGPRRREPVDLAALLPAGATIKAPAATHVVRGDAEQLAPAIAAIGGFTTELRASGATAELHLEAIEHGQRLRIVASGDALAGWQLPTTFEPYYPSRALRGQGSGLALFLAQTVVLAHGGQASARRRPDGALQIDFVLPA